MTVAPTAERARLNPFALPSETGFRFLLLVSATLGSALFAYNWLYFTLSDRHHELLVTLRCDAQFGGALNDLGGSSPAGSTGIDRFAHRTHGFTSCMSAVTHPKGYWMIGGVAGLTLLAFLLYAAMPYWKIRRGRLVPFTAQDDEQVLAELHALCVQAGVTRTPTFVWDPVDPSVSGQAFGAFGRNRIFLPGGVIAKRYTDPDVFHAVVLHELAHIRNRDVDRYYLTVAIWDAFLVAAVLPLVIALATGDGRTFLDVGWRLLVLAGFVYLSRNAVLRTRELYADVRADATGAVGIRQLVGGGSGTHEHRLRRLLRVHPSGTSRAATIGDTDSLFTVGAGQALGAGIVMTLVFHQLVTLVTFFHPDPDPTIWVAALGVAPLVVGIVGMAIWRAAFRAAVRGRPIAGVWSAGLALGAGALLGEVLSFDQLGSVTGSRDPVAHIVRNLNGGLHAQPGIVSSAALGSGVVWVAILVCSMVAFAWWIAVGADVWLRRGAYAAPGRAAIGGWAAATAVLTVWLGIFYLSREVVWPAYLLLRPFTEFVIDLVRAGAWIGPEALYRIVTDTDIVYFASKWFVIPALTLIVVFPLAAAAFYRTPRAASSDPFLGPAEPTPPAWVPFRVLRAVLVGVAVGIGICVALMALRAGIHSWNSLGRRTTDGFSLAFLYWMIAIALIGQATAASIGALVAPGARIFHGALAGLVAGIIGAGAIAFGKTADSCATPLSLNAHAHGCPAFVTLDFTRLVYEYVLGEGIPVALAAAGLTTLFTYAIRHAKAGAHVAAGGRA
jgi:Zn-dependent protease with chaperone function